MKYTTIPTSTKKISSVGLGTMRFAPEIEVNQDGTRNREKTQEEVDRILSAAIEEHGITLIDTSDIYGRGRSEELIGGFFKSKPHLRDQVFIETKTGIHDEADGKWYDLSYEHIIEAADKALKRLGTDHLDAMLLHKSDPLFDPEGIAQAFDELYHAGKVLSFGVSNFTPMHIALLAKYCRQPISICQMQLSIAHALIIDSQINVNKYTDFGIDRDGGILDYCRLHDIRLEAWSILQAHHPWGHHSFIGDPNYPELNQEIDRLCIKYDVCPQGIAAAWIMRHPAGIIPMIGTTNPVHLRETLEGVNVELTRAEWFKLYTAAGKPLP